MLRPKVDVKEFEKYGFKPCKNPYKGCYYLCVSKGCKMLFVSQVHFPARLFLLDPCFLFLDACYC